MPLAGKAMHKEENKYIQSPTDFPELGGGCANVQIIKKAKKNKFANYFCGVHDRTYFGVRKVCRLLHRTVLL